MDAGFAENFEQLKEREATFRWPPLGTPRAELERLVAPDFFEIGASGRVYLRSDALEALEARSASQQVGDWETRDFQCRRLAQDVYLLTYLFRRGGRRTRRATIWSRVGGAWSTGYHQGTLVQDCESAPS